MNINIRIKFLAEPSMLCQAVAISYPWFPAVYIIVAVILIFRFIRDLRGMGKLLGEAEPFHMGKANVLVTDLPVSPCSFGLFSPRILIPRALTDELTDKELETIIIHENTHIRFGHLWIFSIWEIFSSLFWMNPLLRFSFRYLRADMEEICDRVEEIQGAVTSEATNVLNKLSLLPEDVKGIEVNQYR